MNYYLRRYLLARRLNKIAAHLNHLQQESDFLAFSKKYYERQADQTCAQILKLSIERRFSHA